jgi:perosamine synthetase
MIPYGFHHIDDDDINAVVQVLRHGALTQGPAVEAFEQALADYVGARYAVAVASGTAGLHLAALAAGVGPGTSLITTPITFVASANAALYAGGAPEFADIDPSTVNISPAALTEALGRHPNTRVVVPVHFGGLPCDMPAIHDVATRAGAVVIEDAAHALGATYPDGRRVGCCAHSLMTVFSFHPVKLIAAGEGGLITTNDPQVYRHLLRLRSHGINKLDDPLMCPEQAVTGTTVNPWYYEMQELGYHYRITDMQCALAMSQLKKLDRFLARRRELAHAYDRAFAGMTHLRPAQPDRRDDSGLHLYVVRINFAAAGITRAELMLALRSRGIGSQVHYIPVPAQPLYQQRGHALSAYPQAQTYYNECLTIPLFYDLSDAQQAQVVSALQELVG